MPHATKRLGPESPIADSVLLEYPGASGWLECGFLHQAGGSTLVTCDALQNYADREGASFLGRVVGPLLGFKGGVIVAPMWRKLQKVHGNAIKTAFQQVFQHSFEHLVTGHGPPLSGGADKHARAAVEHAAAGG